MAKRKVRHLPMQNRREDPTEAENLSRLTAKMVEDIAKLYRLGLRDSSIANMVGISPFTLREWMTRGMIGSSNPLFNELFFKCGKAVGSLETELVSEIRNHAFGRPAEYAKESTRMPDGSIIERIQLDGDGKPIVIREEIRGNPTWIAWIMERRFKHEWSNQRDNLPVESTPDNIHNNAQQHKENAQDFGVEMSKQERIEMVELVKEKIKSGEL